VQKQEEDRAEADDAPGGQDAIDSQLVISRCRVEVVEDVRKNQQRPAEQTGQPLVAQVDETFGRILGALAAIARSIAGGGYCRNYPAAL